MSDTSTWLENIKTPSFPELKKDLEVDVAIIGGGITGVTAAYLLSKQGKSVALLEKGGIAEGATGWTTAIITQYIDNDLQTLVDKFGKKYASLIWESGREAIDLIKQNVKRHKIDCEFVNSPYYVYATNNSETEEIKAEQEAGERIGAKIKYTEVNDLPIKSNSYLTIRDQAKFHPVKYVSALSKIASTSGALIFTKTEVTNIEGTSVFTKNGVVKAKDIIIATHLPFNEPQGLKFKKAKYITYMLEVELPTGTLPEACFQDLKSPYHYLRVDKRKGMDRILVGGEDHRKDINVSQKKNFKALEKYFKSILPDTKFEITNKWDGGVIETIDGLPYIGNFKDNPNHFYATGFSGNGMTYGTLSAMMLTDRILGKKNKYEKIYRPDRWPTIGQLTSKFVDFSRIFFGGVIKNTFTSG